MTSRVAAPIVWRRHPGALARAVPGSVLLALPGRDDVAKLEGGARLVWDALASPATDADLVARIAATHAVAAGVAAGDVVATRAELEHAGMVVACDA